MQRTLTQPQPVIWRNPLPRLRAVLQRWQQRSRSRRQLALLDDRQLADAGISPSERQAELARPRWR